MADWEFEPSAFEEMVDRRRDKEAEEYLKKNLEPIKGTCPVCQADLIEDPHEGWCPEK